RRRLALGALDLRQQLALGVVGLGAHGLVAQLFGDQHRGVMVDGLVDGGHHAHLEQRLDHVAALHGQLLRQVGHGDLVADGDLAHHRRGRAFEAAHAAAVAAAAAVLAALRFAAAPARAGGGTACAVGGRQVQLAGEARRRVVVVGDGVPAAALVLGRGTAVLGRARRRARRTGRRRLGRLRLGCGLALLLPGRFLGCLALLFLALALGLFLLALALGFLGALAVPLGQALLLGEVALAGFLQLAQHLGALVVHPPLRGSRLG